MRTEKYYYPFTFHTSTTHTARPVAAKRTRPTFDNGLHRRPAAATAAMGYIYDPDGENEGLKIQYLKPGHGAGAEDGYNVVIHYKGALASNLLQFDEGELQFRLGRGRVIKGWDMGVKGMSTGEIRRLFVPSKLAYRWTLLFPTGVSPLTSLARSYVGTPGGPIPPYADLIYEIELLAIKEKEI
eukprot:755109-Hanusia_phi.AAC.4